MAKSQKTKDRESAVGDESQADGEEQHPGYDLSWKHNGPRPEPQTAQNAKYNK